MVGLMIFKKHRDSNALHWSECRLPWVVSSGLLTAGHFLLMQHELSSSFDRRNDLRLEIGLGLLFFFHLMGPGLFTASLGNVLKERGLEDYIHIAMATGPVGCLIAPLMMGAMADKRFDAGKILSVLFVGSAVSLYAAFHLLDTDSSPWAFVCVFGVRALFFTPTFGLISAIAFNLLGERTNRFPRIRVWGTFGWIAAGWLVSSVLHAETSTLGGKLAAVLTLVLAVVCWFLPPMPPPDSVAPKGRRSLASLFGFEAFALLKNRDHRGLFVTSVLLSIPIAAFYAYTPILLREMGDQGSTQTMTLGQVSEIFLLLLLPFLVRKVRLKWILLGALIFGVLRYAFFTFGAMTAEIAWVKWGVALHGLCYVGFFITAQIYLAERIEKKMRAQAQSLLVMLSGGVGTLVGIVVAGELYKITAKSGDLADWMTFWSVLFLTTLLAMTYFLITYRGAGAGSRQGGLEATS